MSIPTGWRPGTTPTTLWLPSGRIGIAFLVLLLGPTIAVSSAGEPALEATAGEAAAFFGNAAATWARVAMATSTLGLIGSLWFVTGFGFLLRRAEGDPAWRAAIATLSGTLLAGYGLIDTSWQAASLHGKATASTTSCQPRRPRNQRQVGDVADVSLVRCLGGEVPVEQIRDFLARRLGDRRLHPPPLLVAADAVLTDYPGDPLVVEPLLGCAVVELRGRPRCPDVLSSSWMARIFSASTVSAAARASRAGAPLTQA
jgi:hypothetical protein